MHLHLPVLNMMYVRTASSLVALALCSAFSAGAAVAYADVSTSTASAVLPAATSSARSLQELHHTITTGKKEVKHAESGPVPGITRTLRHGASGSQVLLLQQFLQQYDLLSASTTTGYFGPATQKAVIAFQKSESLEPVGYVGPKTRARIIAISRYRLMLFKTQTATSTSSMGTTTASSTLSQLPLASISDIVFTTALNEDGSAASASPTMFSSTTLNIYGVLSLANARVTSEVGYLRTYNGAYLDTEVAHPSRSGLRYMHFQWSLVPGQSRAPGQYAVTFYLDGTRVRTLTYIIQ